jgi:biotin operon repressor
VPVNKSEFTDEEFIAAWRRLGSPTAVSDELGMSIRRVFTRRRAIESRYGITLAATNLNRTPGPDIIAQSPEPPPRRTMAGPRSFEADRLRGVLRKGAATLDELAAKMEASRGQVLDAIDELREAGANVHEFGGKYQIIATPAPQSARGNIPTYTSRPDGTYLFGFTSDNHLGSKYSRLDVLASLYDRFAEQGVDRVFNAGNWVDGEATFNRHDLLVHGMEAQVQYLAAEYPRRAGIVTYAVAGDDHEGWYCQREGVDIGRYTERAMHDAGRDDWVDLGFMEAYVRLQHASTGEGTMLHLMHPGGGTAYAISYTVQKICESYDGGDKPAVLLAGHYHKMSYNVIRNVHAIQTGCTQDQTPFMRKKKIPAHVGGGIVQLRQDPATGAITSCRVEFFHYFVRDYYNDRWSHSGDVVLPERAAA